MKKVFGWILLLLLPAFPAETVDGQHNQNTELVTWNVGPSLKRTHGIIRGGNVYIDSVQSSSQTFVRVDDAADSCSNPFWLTRPASDSLGKVRPIWENRLWGTFRGVDADSTTFVLRLQTQERVYSQSTGAYRWSPWTRTGKNGSAPDVTVTDSVVIPNLNSTTAFSQYVYFSAAGVRGRFCPDANIGSGTAAGDTIHFDSLHVFVR